LKNKSADGLTKDIKDLYINIRKPCNSPVKESYAGYTVFPGIAIPFFTLLVQGGLVPSKSSFD
jgi:hypothetical protein